MVKDMPHICGSEALSRELYPAHRAVQPLRRGTQNPLAGLHFDGEAVKNAFALLLIKVTKPSLRNLLSRAVPGTRYG